MSLTLFLNMKYSTLPALQQWNALAQDYLELLGILTDTNTTGLMQAKEVVEKAWFLKKEMKTLMSLGELQIDPSFYKKVDVLEQDFRKKYARDEVVETYAFKLFR